MNEIKSTTTHEAFNNKPCPIQPIIINNHNIVNNNNNNTSNQQTLKFEEKNNNNNKMNVKKDLVTSSTDEIVLNNEVGLNEDLSSISSHNLSDMEDSLEFDVLKGNTNLRAKSAIVTKSIGVGSMTSNKDNKTVNTNIDQNNQNNDKTSFMSQVSSIKNHFLTKNATSDFSSNSLLSNKKTYFTPHFNFETNNDANSDNNDISKESSSTLTNERAIQRSNTSGKIHTKSNIKSILKRSTSDNNLHLIAQSNNHQYANFGLKMEKIEVKDSLEVATNRAKASSNVAKDSTKKKSVRFASNDDTEEYDSQVDQTEDNIINDIEIIQNPGSIARGLFKYLKKYNFGISSGRCK